MAEQVPSVGRVVHYVLPDGRSAGEHRAAIIVRVWDPVPKPDSIVQLHVFIDGSNDYADADVRSSTLWVTSVEFDPTGQKPRTWHWPEYVPAQ